MIDNLPYNRDIVDTLYVQYSQDIDFDYSNNRYPSGDEEGFYWEDVYIPVPHRVDSAKLRVSQGHVWKREKVGFNSKWGLPQPIGLTQFNIDRIVELASQNIKVSEPIQINEQGEITHNPNVKHLPDNATKDFFLRQGLTDAYWFDLNSLYYTKNILATPNSANIHISNIEGIQEDPITGVTFPIVLQDGILSHNSDNGNKHIPLNGNIGQILINNASGSAQWANLPNTIYTGGNGIDVTNFVISAIENQINHNLLLNHLANEHIDWTNATQNILTTGTISGSNLSGTNTGDQDLSGKENVGVAASLDNQHLLDFIHADINHINRAALDLVSGTNTGDQDLSIYTPLKALEDTDLLTGFVAPRQVIRSYDYTTRQVTLIGDLRYYYKGTLKELTSTWVSPAHTDAIGNWFLYSVDGDNFIWTQTPWKFQDVMVAFIRRTNSELTTIGLNEMHSTMDYHSHNIIHYNIGTFRLTGGMVTPDSYIENSPVNADLTPLFEETSIQDEDSITDLPELSVRQYSHLYVGAGGVTQLTINNTYPYLADGNNLPIKYNDVTTGVLIDASTNNKYYNVYQLLIPVLDDINSQRFRMVFVQPQKSFDSLDSAKGEDVSSLVLGDIGNAIPEFTFYTRITYLYSSANNCYGDVRISTSGISYIAGSRANQVNISGFTNFSHLNLTDIFQAGLGVLDGHISDQAQTLYGVKTFNSSPIVPTPTTDFQAATKEYVDNATPAIELTNEAYIYASTLYYVSTNVLEDALNVAPFRSLYSGTITRIEFEIPDLGSNPSGLEINFTINGLDLLATDLTVVEGVNTITTIQSAAISRGDEIKIPVRNSSGSRDVGFAQVRIYVTI